MAVIEKSSINLFKIIMTSDDCNVNLHMTNIINTHQFFGFVQYK